MQGLVRALIVNADDLGHSAAVNAGIAEAHERGVVTSASLMVRRPAAAEGAAYVRATPGLGTGLHLDLDDVPAEELAAEVAGQLAAFRELVGADPTHVDTHHHVHFREPVLGVVRALGEELGVPVRDLSGDARFDGSFWGQDAGGGSDAEAISARALCALVRALPEGVTELCCHPARGRVPGTSYDAEREQELATLCDPAVRETLEREDVRLLSFRELRG
jgi:predicted glycoside hydrolase/deacetylase ChbG (UPF0249 family)